MFQVLAAKEFITHEYGTWSAGSWMPILQAVNAFNDTMRQTSEVVEPPGEFEYASDYGHMDYEQPMFQVLPAEDYGTWTAGSWMPTLHRDNPFYGDIVGQMLLGYLQYTLQHVWMNPYQW
jgi:hypothetical protein